MVILSIILDSKKKSNYKKLFNIEFIFFLILYLSYFSSSSTK